MKKLLNLILIATLFTVAIPASVFANSTVMSKDLNNPDIKVLLNGVEIDSKIGVGLNDSGIFSITTSQGKISNINIILVRKSVPLGKIALKENTNFEKINLNSLLKQARPGDRILAEVYIGKNSYMLNIPLHE